MKNQHSTFLALCLLIGPKKLNCKFFKFYTNCTLFKGTGLAYYINNIIINISVSAKFHKNLFYSMWAM